MSDIKVQPACLHLSVAKEGMESQREVGGGDPPRVETREIEWCVCGRVCVPPRVGRLRS